MLDTNDCVGILKSLAERGRLSKTTLSESLTGEARGVFLQKCGEIERRFTVACTAKNDPCLESGCTMEGDICLNALLNNETEYQKACGVEWLKLFEQSDNRIGVWRG